MKCGNLHQTLLSIHCWLISSLSISNCHSPPPSSSVPPIRKTNIPGPRTVTVAPCCKSYSSRQSLDPQSQCPELGIRTPLTAITAAAQLCDWRGAAILWGDEGDSTGVIRLLGLEHYAPAPPHTYERLSIMGKSAQPKPWSPQGASLLCGVVDESWSMIVTYIWVYSGHVHVTYRPACRRGRH